MSSSGHERDSGMLLSCAERILRGMGCPHEVFVVVITPDVGHVGLIAEVRLRKYHGEHLPALPGEVHMPGAVIEGWDVFTEIERRIVEHMQTVPLGEYVKADDLADALEESGTGDFKGILRSLCLRSRGRLVSVQGKGVQRLGDLSL